MNLITNLDLWEVKILETDFLTFDGRYSFKKKLFDNRLDGKDQYKMSHEDENKKSKLHSEEKRLLRSSETKEYQNISTSFNEESIPVYVENLRLSRSVDHHFTSSKKKRNSTKRLENLSSVNPRQEKGNVKSNSDSVNISCVTSTTIIAAKTEKTHLSIPGGLDYFAQLRALGNAISLNPLEKAAVHAAQYLAMDPLEKMRRQVEQTLEAKLGLLQTKLDNARDPKNKTQRKVYVGNLTPNVNGEFLKQLFTQTLVISYPQWNIPGQDSVVEVQHRDGNKYCFLELRTMEMATAALQINGVTVLGAQLQVSRSIGFLDPVECERAVKEVEQELIRFRSGEDEGPLIRQPGYAELVTKIKEHNTGIFKHSDNLDSETLSAYLSIDSIVTVSSLDSFEEVQELYEDVKAKVSEYGEIICLVIPRPPMGVKGKDLFGKSHYGKVLVQFETSETAVNTKKALNGMIFDGRTVSVYSVTKADFTKAIGISI
jgi:splicing factor U2AF subunit